MCSELFFYWTSCFLWLQMSVRRVNLIIKVAGRKTKTMSLKMLKCSIEVMGPTELDAIFWGHQQHLLHVILHVVFLFSFSCYRTYPLVDTLKSYSKQPQLRTKISCVLKICISWFLHHITWVSGLVCNTMKYCSLIIVGLQGRTNQLGGTWHYLCLYIKMPM